MAVKYTRKEIGKGINLTEIYDPKFKSSYVKVNFIAPIDSNTHCVNALLQYLLISSNSEIKSKTEISKKMAGLYGSSLGTSFQSVGNYEVVGLGAYFIGDKYTIGGEKVSLEVVRQLMLCLLSPDLNNNKFNEQYFKLRKQELIDNIESSVNDKRQYARNQAKTFIFQNEPDGISLMEELELAKKITQEDLIKQYEFLKKQALIEVYVCGDGNTDDALNHVCEELLRLERENVVEVEDYRSNSPLKSQVREVEEKMDIAQSKMVMGYKSQYEDIYVAKLMTTMLGASPFSKLFTNVREKLSLCYYCSASYGDRKGTMIIDSGVETKNIEKAQIAIEDQLKLICDGGFSDEELYNTKIYMASGFRTNCDGIIDLAMWYNAQNYRKTAYSPEDVCERIMKITRQQVVECAKSFKLDTVYVLKAEKEVADDE